MRTNLAVVDIDIGRKRFTWSVSGQLVVRRQIKRPALTAIFEKLSRWVVGMGGVSQRPFVRRTLRGMGFEPRNPAI